MANPTRRKIVAAAIAAVLGPLPCSGPAQSQSAPAEINRQSLSAFLDALLPGGGELPAASTLGLADALIGEARHRPEVLELLAAGSAALNGTGRGPFHGLSPDERSVVADWLSAQPPHTPARQFYTLVRQLAMELYYSREAAIAGLPLNTAPQPRGYPPPWR